MSKIIAALAAALVLAVPAHALCTACWDRVAACESGGRWNLNTGNGYFGGLQWLPSTWIANGGGRYSSMPHYATRLQQMTVASRMSLSNWPVCGRRYWG